MLEMNKKCPQCGDDYPLNFQYCLNDGAQLVTVQGSGVVVSPPRGLEDRNQPHASGPAPIPTEVDAPGQALPGPQPTIDIGTVVDKKYRLDRRLGAGGMGAVYEATHLRLNSKCAVKVLDPKWTQDLSMVQRFELEAMAASRIQHINAVKVMDSGVTPENILYIVMEFVEGRPLTRLINGKAMDCQRAVNLISQICGAIDAVHEKNIIHRDLKPDNILVQETRGEELVKVVDFGVAKVQKKDKSGIPKDITKIRSVIGTWDYMSPEQLKGEAYTTSDIYCIGIIAYEMLTGRLPRNGNTEHNDPIVLPVPPHEVEPGVPVALSEAVMEALQKSPDMRPQSATEFARNLQKALTQPAAAPVKRQTVIVASPVGERSPGGTARKGATAQLPDSSIPEVQPVPVAPAAPRSRPAPWMLGLAAAAILGLGLIAFLSKDRILGTDTAGADVKGGQKVEVRVYEDQYGRMLRLPGGKFMMGDESGGENEKPPHEVSVAPFYLDETEVTNQQYKTFLDANPAYPAPENWKERKFLAGEEQFPVTHVTWENARAYAKFVGRRLPTEAEWEYAARSGGKPYRFPWGDQWESGKANAGPSTATSDVHDYKEDINIFGIRGLAGNVSEWVEDRDTRYSDGKPTFPQCPECRVYRGGNFKVRAGESTSFHRFSYHPSLGGDPKVQADYRNFIFPRVGFRCAKDDSAPVAQAR